MRLPPPPARSTLTWVAVNTPEQLPAWSWFKSHTTSREQGDEGWWMTAPLSWLPRSNPGAELTRSECWAETEPCSILLQALTAQQRVRRESPGCSDWHRANVLGAADLGRRLGRRAGNYSQGNKTTIPQRSCISHCQLPGPMVAWFCCFSGTLLQHNLPSCPSLHWQHKQGMSATKCLLSAALEESSISYSSLQHLPSALIPFSTVHVPG